VSAIVAAYAALRSAGEARLSLLFAAKISAASVTGRPEDIQAAVSALIRERDAALKNFAEELRAAERAHVRRVKLGKVHLRRKRRRTGAAGGPSRTLASFRPAAALLCKKKGRSRGSRPVHHRAIVRSALFWRLGQPTI